MVLLLASRHFAAAACYVGYPTTRTSSTVSVYLSNIL